MLIGYHLGKQLLGENRGVVLILSIGTGEPENVPHALDIAQGFFDRSWFAHWRPGLNALSDGPVTLSRSLIDTMPDAKCFRLQMTLPQSVDTAMDNAAPSNIFALKDITKRFLQEEGVKMDLIVDIFAKLVKTA